MSARLVATARPEGDPLRGKVPEDSYREWSFDLPPEGREVAVYTNCGDSRSTLHADGTQSDGCAGPDARAADPTCRKIYSDPHMIAWEIRASDWRVDLPGRSWSPAEGRDWLAVYVARDASGPDAAEWVRGTD